jgi:hypothetical protein
MWTEEWRGKLRLPLAEPVLEDDRFQERLRIQPAKTDASNAALMKKMRTLNWPARP